MSSTDPQSNGTNPTPPGTGSGSDEMGLRPLARRLNIAVWLSRCAVPVAAVVIIAGLALLFSRLLAPHLARYCWVILLAVPGVLVIQWLRCRAAGLFFTGKDAAEMADYLGQADGLVATAFERPHLTAHRLGAVGKQIQARATRALRLQPKWFAWRLVPSLAFATAVLFVPPRQPVARPELNVLSTLAQPLQEKLEVSAEILSETEKEKLQEQIEKLKADEGALSREKWEALEEVEKRLNDAVNQGDVAAQQLSKSLEQLAELAEQQRSANGSQQSPELQSQIKDLANSIEQLANSKQSPLSQEWKKQIAQAAGNCKGGNCSAADLDKLRQLSQSLSEKLSNLKQQTGDKGGNPGSGGISRGRADAELTFGRERRLADAKFKEEQLENQYFDESSLTDMGITTIEPKVDPGQFKPGTVKQFETPTAANVTRTQIAPSQRGVVERYFK